MHSSNPLPAVLLLLVIIAAVVLIAVMATRRRRRGFRSPGAGTKYPNSYAPPLSGQYPLQGQYSSPGQPYLQGQYPSSNPHQAQYHAVPTVNIYGSHGVQIGDGNFQRNKGYAGDSGHDDSGLAPESTYPPAEPPGQHPQQQ